jgi:hypothetical protein
MEVRTARLEKRAEKLRQREVVLERRLYDLD